MQKTKIRLEIRKVGTFSRSTAKAEGFDTGDPTSGMTSMKTTLGSSVFLAQAPRPLN